MVTATTRLDAKLLIARLWALGFFSRNQGAEG